MSVKHHSNYLSGRTQLWILVLLLSAFFTNIAFAGGPWTPGKNKGIFITNFTPLIYGNVSNDRYHHLNTNRRVTELSLQLYGEYGITDKFAVLGDIPIRYAQTSTQLKEGDFTDTIPSGSLFGPGNISLSFKYKFYDGKLVIAGSIRTIFNTALSKLSAGLRTGYSTWAFYPTLHLGKSFTERMYLQAEAYVGFRTNNYSDEWGVMVEYGGRFKKPIWMALLVQIRESFRNGSKTNGDGIHTALYLNDQAYLVYTLKCTYEATQKFGLNWSLGGGIRTSLIARTPAFTIGIYYKW